MERSTAQFIYDQLEAVRDTTEEGDPAVWDVRLDAGSSRNSVFEGARDFRLFVRPARARGWIKADDLRFICELVDGTCNPAAVQDDDIFLEIENNGVAIY